MRRRTKKTEAATAYHEAGHVVAAWQVKGLRGVGAVTIEPGEGYRGRSSSKYMFKNLRPDVEVTPHTRLRIENEILLCLAGPAAQRKFNPRSVRRHHGLGDKKVADELASYVTGTGRQFEAFMNWMWARAEDLVNLHWPTIEDLAAALLDSRKFSGRQMREWLSSWMDAKCG